MKQLLISGLAIFSVLTASAQSNTADEKAIRQIFTTIEQGWNTKNGELFASVFAETHDYIVVNGFYFPKMSRKQNAMIHQGLFNGIYKNNNVIAKVDQVNYLRPDLAMVTILGANYPKDSTPTDPTSIMTILVEKKNNEWKIIHFHNHSLAESFASPAKPMPAEVMYSGWYNK
jgi:uncharacterized protein (TIGR02246 family)